MGFGSREIHVRESKAECRFKECVVLQQAKFAVLKGAVLKLVNVFSKYFASNFLSD